MYTYRTYKQVRPIHSSKINIDDLKRVCLECFVVNKTAQEKESNYQADLLKIFDGEDAEEKARKADALEKEMSLINNHSLIVVTIEGASGERFTIVPTDLEKAFSHLNIPRVIKKVRIDNWSNFQIFANKLPYFRMTIELDFSDTMIWDFQDYGYRNESVVEVFGLEEIWTLGAVEKLIKAVERRPSTAANFIHRYIKYGFLLWLVGVPGIILALNLYISDVVAEAVPGVQAIAVVSVGLFMLTIFRAFYNYIRWLFPYLELDEQPKKLQTLQRSVALF